jgi:hypothetical protein
MAITMMTTRVEVFILEALCFVSDAPFGSELLCRMVVR